MAEMIGGQHTTSTAATQLANDDTPCSQIIVRAGSVAGGTMVNSTTVGYFGGSDVTSTPTNAHGYMEQKESYTFGPKDGGGYIRAKDIYLAFTNSADTVFWDGWPL